jgi:hypothetical protein
VNGGVVGLGLGKLTHTGAAQGEIRQLKRERGLDLPVMLKSRSVCHESEIQMPALLVSWIGMNSRVIGPGLAKLHRDTGGSPGRNPPFQRYSDPTDQGRLEGEPRST